jgi:hypothetical protein
MSCIFGPSNVVDFQPIWVLDLVFGFSGPTILTSDCKVDVTSKISRKLDVGGMLKETFDLN